MVRSYTTDKCWRLGLIADVGAVVSEYPPGGTPGRHRCLWRNRLIAGLTAGTVVVEAGRPRDPSSASLNDSSGGALISLGRK